MQKSVKAAADTVDGRNPANQLIDIYIYILVYPIIYRALYIPGGGLGVLPLTVWNIMVLNIFSPDFVPTSSVCPFQSMPKSYKLFFRLRFFNRILKGVVIPLIFPNAPKGSPIFPFGILRGSPEFLPPEKQQPCNSWRTNS